MNLHSVKKICTIVLLTFTILLSGISIVHAEERNIDYTPLVSLPGINKAGTTTTTLSTYIPGIFKLSIGVAGVLAVLMIVFGGVEYITAESLGGKKNGQDRINNALIGLVLIIGSYAILSTISPSLLSFDLNVRKVPLPTPEVAGPSCPVDPCALNTACPANSRCVAVKTTTNGVLSCTKNCILNSPSGGTGTPCMGSACYSQYSNGSPFPDDSAERALLSGITITSTTGNTTACKKVGESGCTSMYKIGSAAINGLLYLKGQCAGCKILITGGSEFWAHTSHGIGMNRVDIDYTAGDALTSFITKGKVGTPSVSCVRGQPAWFIGSAEYVLENNNHWHVCYSRSAL